MLFVARRFCIFEAVGWLCYGCDHMEKLEKQAEVCALHGDICVVFLLLEVIFNGSPRPAGQSSWGQEVCLDCCPIDPTSAKR